MKSVKWGLVIVAAATLGLALGGVAYAFHSGGVAECNGCHSMHQPKAGGSFLLIGTDPSSTCLSCHEHAGDTGPSSYHVSTAPADMPAGVAPLQRSPGGDFGWLKKDYTFTQRGSTVTDFGYENGHSIVAVDKGYAVDPGNPTAPGGTFPSAQLGCTSCHDPHGQYRRLANGTVSNTGLSIKGSGSYHSSAEPDANNAVGVYRLLAGSGYSKAPFAGVPAAKSPTPYNRTEAASQTRVAYGNSTAGGHVAWGTWCATCHQDMHSSTDYVHPVDQAMSGTVIANYNKYVKSGDWTGTSASSFTSLVPFIQSTGDYAQLATNANPTTVLTGPSGGDRVSCLSCHRAHASGWKHALRWNMEGEFITQGGVYPANFRGRQSTEVQAAYYDRAATQFAENQRVLCNKCHAKD
jgi:hypothetical protein